MKNLFTKLVTGYAPQIKMALTAVITWVITWLITRFGLQIEEDRRAEISTYIAGAVWAIIASLALKKADTGIRTLQAINPDPAVRADGDVGPVTIAAAKLQAQKLVAPGYSANEVPLTLTVEEREAILKARKEAQDKAETLAKPK